MDVEEGVALGPWALKMYRANIFIVLAVLIGTVILVARRMPPEAVWFLLPVGGGFLASIFLPVFLLFCVYERKRPAWGHWPLITGNVMLGVQAFVVWREYL